MSPNSRVLLTTFILVLFASSAQAGLFRFESETAFTGRKNALNQNELPIYETIESSYVSDKEGYDLHTNFSLFGDPVNKTYDFQLLSLNGRFEINPSLNLILGRSYNSYYLTRSATTDSVTLEYKLQKNLNFYAYLGNQLQLELRNIAVETAIAGVGMYYSTPNLYPWKFNLRTEHFNHKNNPHTETLSRFSLSKQFSITLEPEIFYVFETDSASGRALKNSFGVDLYPSYESYWSLKTSTYSPTKSNGWEQPIATIFSSGTITENSLRWTKLVTAKLNFSLNGATLNLPLPGGEISHGRQYGININMSELNHYRLSDEIIMFDSYGGKATGNNLKAEYMFARKNSVILNSEAVSYEKVTSSKRTTYHTEFGFGSVWDQFHLSILLEHSQNNQVKQDYGVLAKILYLDWKEL